MDARDRILARRARFLQAALLVTSPVTSSCQGGSCNSYDGECMREVRVAPKQQTLCPGQRFSIAATEWDQAMDLAADARGPIRWSSNRPDVATVDAAGNVTAVAPGRAYIHPTGDPSCKITYVDVRVDVVACSDAGSSD